METELVHGKLSTYTNKGCRCEDCKAAAREYRQGLPKKPKKPRQRKEPEHGTYSRYTNHKCRCEACKAAGSEYFKSRKRVVLPAGDERHGTVTGYSNWSCRCEACKAAMSEYMKPRSRNNALMHKYGMSEAEFEGRLAAQGGVCASCGDPEDEDKRRFHVDHDHTTGEIRGILCHGCNVSLGHLKDDISRITSLANYLGQFQASRILE